MCKVVFFQCKNEGTPACVGTEKKYLQPPECSEKVPMVFGAIKNCHFWDRLAEKCTEFNPPVAVKDMEIITLSDCSAFECIDDVINKVQKGIHRPMLMMEKKPYMQRQAVAVGLIEIIEAKIYDAKGEWAFKKLQETDSSKAVAEAERVVRTWRNVKSVALQLTPAELDRQLKNVSIEQWLREVQAAHRAPALASDVNVPSSASSGGPPPPSSGKLRRATDSGSQVSSSSRSGSEAPSKIIPNTRQDSDAEVAQAPNKKGNPNAAGPSARKKK